MNNLHKYLKIRNQYYFVLTALSLLTVMFFIPSCTSNDVYTNAVRLHVVANSDSEVDQEIKLIVRDEIVQELFEPLEKTTSSDESYQYLLDNTSEIEAIANNILMKNGYSYNANVEIGIHTYPTRMYENATLPAGEYRSVRVILGDGSGRNWWCVVYPPMCVEVSEDEDAVLETEESSDIDEEKESVEDMESEENKENKEDIVFKSSILDRLGVDTPQPKPKAKKRLLKWLNSY